MNNGSYYKEKAVASLESALIDTPGWSSEHTDKLIEAQTWAILALVEVFEKLEKDIRPNEF